MVAVEIKVGKLRAHAVARAVSTPTREGSRTHSTGVSMSAATSRGSVRNSGRVSVTPTKGVHDEVADDDPERRERADDADVARIDADFFVRFAQRRGFRRLARIEPAAGQADLSRMMRQIVAARRQGKRRAGFAGIQKDERGGDARAGRVVVGTPALTRRGSGANCQLRARPGSGCDSRARRKVSSSIIYSLRSASVGGTRVARRAGSHAAAVAAAASANTAAR